MNELEKLLDKRVKLHTKTGISFIVPTAKPKPTKKTKVECLTWNYDVSDEQMTLGLL